MKLKWKPIDQYESRLVRILLAITLLIPYLIIMFPYRALSICATNIAVNIWLSLVETWELLSTHIKSLAKMVWKSVWYGKR